MKEKIGSRTTSVVAKMMGRNSVGIEKEAKYLSIIKKRMGQQKFWEDAFVEYFTK